MVQESRLFRTSEGGPKCRVGGVHVNLSVVDVSREVPTGLPLAQFAFPLPLKSTRWTECFVRPWPILWWNSELEVVFDGRRRHWFDDDVFLNPSIGCVFSVSVCEPAWHTFRPQDSSGPSTLLLSTDMVAATTRKPRVPLKTRAIE